MLCPLASLGVVSETYLPPKTVVALIWALTFCGISARYCGYTSKLNLAAGLPSGPVIGEMVPTRPISTPL
jgi:hypothetical protein